MQKWHRKRMQAGNRCAALARPGHPADGCRSRIPLRNAILFSLTRFFARRQSTVPAICCSLLTESPHASSPPFTAGHGIAARGGLQVLRRCEESPGREGAFREPGPSHGALFRQQLILPPAAHLWRPCGLLPVPQRSAPAHRLRLRHVPPPAGRTELALRSRTCAIDLSLPPSSPLLL